MTSYLSDKSQILLDNALTNSAQGYLVVGNESTNSKDFIYELALKVAEVKNLGDESERILKLTPDKNNKIGKKQIDEILLRLRTKQPTGKRVILIEDSDKLSIAAHNSLLKTLEEPGINTCVIISAKGLNFLPATVVSRLQIIRLPKLSSEDFSKMDNLSNLDNLQKLVISSGGNYQLLSGFSQDASKQEDYLEDVELCKKVLALDTYNRVISLKSLWKDKDRLSRILGIISNLCRAAMYSSKANPKKAKQWSERMASVVVARKRLLANVTPRLIITELMIQL